MPSCHVLPDETGFAYRGDALMCESVPVTSIAEQFGTPVFIYSRKAIESAFFEYERAFGQHPHMVMYAVKANSNLAVIHELAMLGAGFDIVSGGELLRVLAAGGQASKIVFSGVGKTDEEIRLGLKHRIRCFNIESISELDRIARIARETGTQAPISVRVNPDVDAKTHPYISTGLKNNKFGVAYDQVLPLYKRAAACPDVRVIGIDCHIGSQIMDLAPFADAADRLIRLALDLKAEGIPLSHIDFGGGLGVRYRDEIPPSAGELVSILLKKLDENGCRDLCCLVEPGRFIVANSGILVTRVLQKKIGETKNFAIVDAAMNDMGRPMFYDAWMGVVPVQAREQGFQTYNVVGPICESGDWLAKDRLLSIEEGDLLAITSAGAYGMSMSSNYNSRPRAAEVLVDGDTPHCIRLRERAEDLWRNERIPAAKEAS